MGIKSTIVLTRREAEDLYIEFKLPELRRKLRSMAALLNNTELENILEELNDERYVSGEGFENYIIDDNKQESE